MRFSTAELAAHLGGEQVGPDVTVDGASIDTRTVQPGQLYVPIVAERDGHEFIRGRAGSGGARPTSRHESPSAATAIVVEDTAAALMQPGRAGPQRAWPAA